MKSVAVTNEMLHIFCHLYLNEEKQNIFVAE